MRTIWKFPLNMRGWNEVGVGGVSQVVLAAIDPASGAPAVWIDHDPDGAPMARSFVVVGTGHEIPDPDADHVGSMIDRTFVWHIYERRL